MKQTTFPWLAAGISLVLGLVLLRATADARSAPLLPPLTLLFMSEFGFLVSVVGAWLGGRGWSLQRSQWTLLLVSGVCGIMALAFLFLGIALWLGMVSVTPA